MSGGCGCNCGGGGVKIDKTFEINKRLQAAADEGRLSCAVAQGIADDLGVSYKDVGKAADNLKLKIRDCQLGCF